MPNTPEPQPTSTPSRSGRVPRATGWARWLPGVQGLRHYEWGWLKHDVAAGLVLTAVLVPVGLAYAVASGVPAIAGLYATLMGLLAYALFGPSRVLVLGPDSSLVALILGVVLPLSGGDPARALMLASLMALVSGLICMGAGLARLGFVTELLSKPIRYGYMNGIALTVLIGQLPALLGVGKPQGDGVLQELHGLMVAWLWQGNVNSTSLMLGLGTLAALLLLKRSKRMPGALIAVAGATALALFFDWERTAALKMLGSLPQGLPALILPEFQTSDIGTVLMGGLAIALVSFADTSVLSRTYAARFRTAVDPNQEMVALGLSNVTVGLFQGIPVSASATRTPVAEAAGAKTQMAGVVGALAVGALLLFAPNFLRHVPTAALAAVVMAAAFSLVEVAELRRIWRVQRWEFWLSIGCSAGVVLLGAIPGIGLAIAIAVIEFLWGAWRPHSAVLGRVDGVKGYHDISRYPQARVVPGLVLFRWDAPLFFANAELFKERALDAVDAAEAPVQWLVVGAEPVTQVDVTAADALAELHATLREAGIALHFAEMKDPVKDKLKRFGLFEQLGEERFFATLGESVNHFIKAHGVPWVDWEDRRH